MAGRGFTRILGGLIVCILAVSAQAQTSERDDVRRRALELYNQNKFVDAIPLLERVIATNPSDLGALEALALSTLGSTSTIENPEERKRIRLRARTLALRARDLGDNSNLLSSILESIAEDGSDPPRFSSKQDVDAAMNEGEAAFARGDFEKALAAYERALSLNPQQYEAALFIGDVYFKQSQMDKATQWFARAVEIDGNRETAHRYWGDAFMRSGRMTEARDKFIDGIIAEPYSRTAWTGLLQWGQRNRIQIGHPRVDLPQSSVPRSEEKSSDNTADRKQGSAAWASYAASRAAWSGGAKFGEAFPNERAYRHSLMEETEALRLAAETLAAELRDGSLKPEQLDPSLANLRRLNEAGLIEAYILLAKPDDGIVRDYANYRQQHRDKLRQYLTDYVVAQQ
jgi:tetratricopeptide (TPR) repeat protein